MLETQLSREFIERLSLACDHYLFSGYDLSKEILDFVDFVITDEKEGILVGRGKNNTSFLDREMKDLSYRELEYWHEVILELKVKRKFE
jgi:hypothetical protein